MKLSASFSLAFVCVATSLAAERPIQLRLVDPEFQLIFKGKTQSGEKMQSFEIRKLFSKNEAGQLVDGGINFYVIFNPDMDTAFWPPQILKEVRGFDPVIRQIDSNTVNVFYHAGAHANLKQTWKLNGPYGPVLEKEEEIDWREMPKRKLQ